MAFRFAITTKPLTKDNIQMFKKTISYTDYNDMPQTETLYFNLNKTELMDMEYADQSLLKRLQTLIASENAMEGLKIIKEIILAGYGVKSDDGRRFIKNQALRDDFIQTEAYSELFLELGGSAEKAAEFVNGLLPKDLLAQAQETMNKDFNTVQPNSPNVPQVPAASALTSEQARQRSMEAMQGYKKPAEPQVKTSPVDISTLTPEQKAELLKQLS